MVLPDTSNNTMVSHVQFVVTMALWNRGNIIFLNMHHGIFVRTTAYVKYYHLVSLLYHGTAKVRFCNSLYIQVLNRTAWYYHISSVQIQGFTMVTFIVSAMLYPKGI